MKREEKNQLTKRKIVDSALREFSKNGYRGCSVNDICRHGGVSKGIVYHYFDTKESLYLFCVEECFALLTKHIGEDLIYFGMVPLKRALRNTSIGEILSSFRIQFTRTYL